MCGGVNGWGASTKMREQAVDSNMTSCRSFGDAPVNRRGEWFVYCVVCVYVCVCVGSAYVLTAGQHLMK